MKEKTKIAIPGVIKGMTVQLVIAYVLNFVGFTFLISTMSLTGKALLEGEGAAGVPLSLLSGVALFSALPFGKMADKLGRKAAIILMIVCYALGDIIGLVAIQMQNGVLYLVAMCMLGIGVGAMALFATAVTDLYPAMYKGRASGFAQLGVMAANTLGYLIAGQLITYLGTTSVYYVAIGCQVAAIIMMLALKREPRDVGRSLTDYWPKEAFSAFELNPPVETKAVPKGQNRPTWKLLFVWPILLAVILRVWIHLGANYVNVALPVAFTEIGYSAAAISVFLVARALASFLTADFTGRMIDRFGRKLGYIGAPIVTALGILLIAFSGMVPLMLVGCALIGFGNAIANVVPPAVCNDVTYLPERSKAVAIFGISTNIGGFVFPVPMAIVLSRFGLPGLAVACTVFLMIPVLLAVFTLKEKKVGEFKGYELSEETT